MHSTAILTCCLCFLTLAFTVPLSSSTNVQSAQQVEGQQAKSSPAKNATDKIQADATHTVTYMEGGSINVSSSETPIAQINSTSKVNTTTIQSTLEEVASANRPNRPYGREHVAISPSNNDNPKVIPVVENNDALDSFPSTEHKKAVVARKGVSQNATTSSSLASSTATASTTTSTTTTTTKPIPKKPLITIGNDDEPFAPSHFESSKKNSSVKGMQKIPTIESYEYGRSKSSSSDYIVPIVGVILSVPLVSVILNVIYKKTKEWWHHRHYSRMDFLIDGMYNN